MLTITSPGDLISSTVKKKFSTKGSSPKYILITTCITTFLCYFYEMIWGLGCPDTLCEGVYYYRNADFSTSQARWMVRYINELFGKNIVIPALIVCIYCLMLGVSAYIICYMIHIQKPLEQILITSMMISFPVVLHHLAYMYMSIVFSFSFLMVVVGTFLLRKKKVYTVIPGTLCYLLMMGSYQGFIGAISALAIVLLISDTLANDTLKEGFLNFALSAASGVVACLLNIPVYKLMIRIHNTGMDERVSSFSFSDIIKNLGFSLKYSYIWFFNLFKTDTLSRNRIYAIIFGVMIILTVFIVIRSIRERKFGVIITIIISLLLLPLAMNIVLLIFPYNGLRMVLWYQFVLIYPLMFVLHEHSISGNLGNIMRYISFLAVILMFIGNVITANCTARMYKLCYDHYKQEFTLALGRVYELDGYKPNITPILTGGAPPLDFIASRYHYIFRYAETPGSIVFWLDPYGMITCRYNFFADFLGVDAQNFDTSEYQEIVTGDEYSEMPLWPESGSVKMIDGMAVIKFTDEPPLY